MSGANGRKLSQDGLPPGSQEQTDLTDIYTVGLPENIQKTSSQRSPETDIGDTDRQTEIHSRKLQTDRTTWNNWEQRQTAADGLDQLGQVSLPHTEEGCGGQCSQTLRDRMLSHPPSQSTSAPTSAPAPPKGNEENRVPTLLPQSLEKKPIPLAPRPP